LWHNSAETSGLKSFKTVARSIQWHYADITNFFNNRSTNASAESFDAKIKGYRAAARGVRDINFFLFSYPVSILNPSSSPNILLDPKTINSPMTFFNAEFNGYVSYLTDKSV